MHIEKYNDHCCGCGECVAICPAKAVSMKYNKQGFAYPIVDTQKCIDCSKCVKQCSFNNGTNINDSDKSQQYYAFKHIDESIRESSRSGGIFTALSDIVLGNGGVVYGCKLENCRRAVHTRATTKEERDAFRGSKYIQSETHHIFKDVKDDIKKGLLVLFSGTSCQVNAIKDYCKDLDCSKLILVDIVCHGVPSPKVWNDYLKYIEKTNNKKIVSVDFRDKRKFGWAAHEETVIFENGTDYSDNVFRRLFYDHLILRNDCFECPYRSLNRISDISIADCWGIAEHYPEFDDNKGVSLVLINTEKGLDIYKKTQREKSIEVDVQKLLQPPLRMNWDKPTDYSEFWKYYNSHSFKKVLNKYVLKKPSFCAKLKYHTRSTLAKCYRFVFRKK